MSPQKDPISIRHDLEDTFLRYYNTAWKLDLPGLMEERERLLRGTASVAGPLVMELMSRYAPGSPIREYAGAIGLNQKEANLLGEIVLGGPDLSPYEHQEAALRAALSGADVPHNPVVTTGTGSGKTEAFLLPTFARLLREGRAWLRSAPEIDKWWESSPKADWRPMRKSGPVNRAAAVRTMILYPTNALVEDQMTRLRATMVRLMEQLDVATPPFYFGRYTGATPSTLPGGAFLPSKVSDTGQIPALIDGWIDEKTQAQNKIRDFPETPRELAFQVPDPFVGEMLTRWDMLSAPPDIFITNQHMLNIMLMRSSESAIFSKTRDWLHDNAENVFTLVIDELHELRGTQGTETGMVIRNLRRRLGLAPESSQFRIIGTSATLGGDETLLENLTGLPSSTFTIVRGTPVSPPLAPLGGDEMLGAVQSGSSVESIADMDTSASVLVASAFTVSDGAPAPMHIEDLANALFPSAGAPLDNLSRLLQVVSAQSDQDKNSGWSFRNHFFFRNVKGIWACSNPECDQIDDEFDRVARNVGKLYPTPELICNCGSTILQLLYCQECGDIYLGGFVKEGQAGEKYLSSKSPSSSNISLTPERYKWEQFILIHPGHLTEDHNWPTIGGRGGGEYKAEFRAAEFDHRTGMLLTGRPNPNVVSFNVTAKEHSSWPALPDTCFSCGIKYSIPPHAADEFKQGKVYTPIRGHRTGLYVANAVLQSRFAWLCGEEPETRKTLVFYDSRDEVNNASSTAAEMYYNQTLGSAIFQRIDALVHTEFDRVIKLLGSSNPDDQWSESELALKVELTNRFTNASVIAVKYENNLPLVDLDFEVLEQIRARVNDVPWISIRDVSVQVVENLVKNGSNPAGPKQSRQTSTALGGTRSPWWQLYDAPNGISTQDQTKWPAQSQIRDSFTEREKIFGDWVVPDILGLIFGKISRDFESQGICSVVPIADEPISTTLSQFTNDDIHDLVQDCIRIIGLAGRYRGGSMDPLRGNAPFRENNSNFIVPALRKYLVKIGPKGTDKHGLFIKNVKSLLREMRVIGDRWQLLAENLKLERVNTHEIYRCETCGFVHSRRGLGFCLNRKYCQGKISVDPEPIGEEGYTAWLARQPLVRRSFAELTADTGVTSSPNRNLLSEQNDLRDQQQVQRDFKWIPRDDQPSLVTEIDYLAATTTMEMGIDIGDLQSVILGTLPPSAFNFRQRVGRTGRRDRLPFANSLTICRDRLIDEHFFRFPLGLIKAGESPVTTPASRVEIIRRVIAEEILRTAFLTLKDEPDPSTRNVRVHGNFGTEPEWVNKYSAPIRDAISSMDVTELVHDLTFNTGLDQEQRDEIEQWLRVEFMVEIDITAQRSTDGEDLALRLAEDGHLPMFGFPTRSRALKYKDGADWVEVSQRSLDQAVTNFSPNTEILRSNWVYRSSQISDDFPDKPGAEPIHDFVYIHECPSCGQLNLFDERFDGLDCSLCETPIPKADLDLLVQPRGFIANLRHDFGLNNEIAPATPNEPLLSFKDTVIAKSVRNLKVRSDDDVRLVLINSDSLSADDVHVPTGSSRADIPPEFKIGSVKKTDAISIELNTTGDAVINLRGPSSGWNEARAAYESFAELFRLHAAMTLGIDPRELRTRVQRTQPSISDTPKLYLIDELDNGAGFSFEIGNKSTLEAVLDSIQTKVESFESTHAECDTACAGCLATYDTRHKELDMDWRLATDLLDLANAGSVKEGRWDVIAGKVIHSIENQFEDVQTRQLGSCAWAVARQGKGLVISKPFSIDGLSVAASIDGMQASGVTAINEMVGTEVDPNQVLFKTVPSALRNIPDLVVHLR